jgi:hypothetical protein
MIWQSFESGSWTFVTFWYLPLVDGVTAVVAVGLLYTMYTRPFIFRLFYKMYIWMFKLCSGRGVEHFICKIVFGSLSAGGVWLIIIVLWIEFSNHSRSSCFEIKSIFTSIWIVVLALGGEIRSWLAISLGCQTTNDDKISNQPNSRPSDDEPNRERNNKSHQNGSILFQNSVSPSFESESNPTTGDSQHKGKFLPQTFYCCSVQKMCIFENKETFHIVLSCVQCGIIVVSSLSAILIPCGQLLSDFSTEVSLKCRFMEYDVTFIGGGNGEAYFSSFLCIISSFFCLKMCYYACITNIQNRCCYSPLLLSTILTPVIMGISSRYRCSVFGYLIMPNDFTQGFEINARSKILFIAAICWVIVVVYDGIYIMIKGNPTEHMEHQER